MRGLRLEISDVSAESAGKRLAIIFEAIIREREFQTNKYGPVVQDRPTVAELERILAQESPEQPKFGGHELAAWLLIVEKELDEAKDAAVHGGFQKVTGRNSIRAELLQIAAVCVAALEQHGVQE